MEKIKLEKYRHRDDGVAITHSLPFFKSKKGNSKYYHRVRAAGYHKLSLFPAHVSITFWCGGGGFIGEKGALYSEIPEGGVLCAVCEGKAIGAGLDGARKINGRDVMYSPRK